MAPSVVAGTLQNFWQCNGVRVERHLVEKNTVRKRTLSRQNGGASGRADGHARDGVDKAHALARESVEVRRPHIWIARKTEGLRAPLVGEHDDDIRRRIRGAHRDGA